MTEELLQLTTDRTYRNNLYASLMLGYFVNENFSLNIDFSYLEQLFEAIKRDNTKVPISGRSFIGYSNTLVKVYDEPSFKAYTDLMENLVQTMYDYADLNVNLSVILPKIIKEIYDAYSTSPYRKENSISTIYKGQKFAISVPLNLIKDKFISVDEHHYELDKDIKFNERDLLERGIFIDYIDKESNFAISEVKIKLDKDNEPKIIIENIGDRVIKYITPEYLSDYMVALQFAERVLRAII